MEKSHFGYIYKFEDKQFDGKKMPDIQKKVVFAQQSIKVFFPEKSRFRSVDLKPTLRSVAKNRPRPT